MLSPKCTPSDYLSIIYLDFKLIAILRQSKYFLYKQSFLRLSECRTLLLLLTVASLVPALPELGVKTYLPELGVKLNVIPPCI